MLEDDRIHISHVLSLLTYIRNGLVVLDNQELKDTCVSLYYRFDKKVWDDIKDKLIIKSGRIIYKVYETNQLYLVKVDKNIENFTL